MKPHCLVSVLPCLASGAVAFPAYLGEALGNDVDSKLSEQLAGVFHEAAHERRLLFDPATAPIDVAGSHRFIPPDFEKGDQRGPCPGLNALANHGYISRDGVTGIAEVTGAVNRVFGMGIDISAILAVLGTVFVGDPLSADPGFSIGDVSRSSPGGGGALDGVLGRLLGTPRGLNGSHNIIEGDASLTRADLYVTGDASTMVMDQFRALYDMSPGEGGYDMDLFGERSAARFRESVATNPNFYYGPFTGMIARNAAYLFACRMFSNYSSENPATGVLNKETLKSFFAVQGQEGNLAYNRGWERIPENWYRMPVDYTLVQLNLDLVALIAKHPKLGSIGGNMGGVNSFAGVDLGDLTGGVMNLAKLLEGNNLLCFVFEVLKTVSPNSLSTVFSIVEKPLSMVTDALGTALVSLSCPAFKDMQVGGQSLDQGLKARYPGARMSDNVL
ncbi:oxidase [Colletotrichum falcatum]|nr:oxidase [Colletotrichum falcatum]